MSGFLFAFEPGDPIRLSDLPTAAEGAPSEAEARERISGYGPELIRYQDYLMAHERYGLLVLFQGMDASGKDEAIQHVLSSFDPRGVEFKQFKRMTEKELRHDYLWRAVAALPARGQIGIFNRSYYEHVVSERIHPEQLEKQQLPDEAMEDLWQRRYGHINHFEAYLRDNGIRVLKFFMHVSPDEQRRRLLERMEHAESRWQFDISDVEERAHWDAYMETYSEVLAQTNTTAARWYVVPADAPWSARAAVASVVLEEISALHTGYPELSPDERQVLEKARAALDRSR